MREFDERARAAMLRSGSLSTRCAAEMRKARLPDHAGAVLPRFDSAISMKQPLLQSLYHEVLRTQATSLVSRNVEQGYQVGGYTLTKGSVMMASVHSEHMDKARWERQPGAENHPVEEFWPERFLEYPDDPNGDAPSSLGKEP